MFDFEEMQKRMAKQDKAMQKNLVRETSLFGPGKVKEKKKRKVLTPAQRLYVWEHPKMYGRKCNICSERISKMSELELDHTHPYSKGGSKMNLAHKECNRMKGSKSLRHIQKKMGFKTLKRKTRIAKPKTRETGPTQLNILTGKMERIKPWGF